MSEHPLTRLARERARLELILRRAADERRRLEASKLARRLPRRLVVVDRSG